MGSPGGGGALKRKSGCPLEDQLLAAGRAENGARTGSEGPEWLGRRGQGGGGGRVYPDERAWVVARCLVAKDACSLETSSEAERSAGFGSVPGPHWPEYMPKTG